MAKPVIVIFEGNELSLDPVRVDRSKIYGGRKRIAIDSQGLTCTKAALTLDGTQLLRSGMTAQAYFTPEGRWVQRSEMVGLDSSGNRIENKPSTLGIPQVLEGPIDPGEVLALSLESVFLLQATEEHAGLAAALRSGAIFRFPFNYAAGLEVETAYLVGNDEGTFALVGKPVEQRWVEESEAFVPMEIEEDSDELDFEMM